MDRRFTTASRGLGTIAVVVTLAIAVGGCDLGSRPRGSSIRTENRWTGIDFIVRATSADAVTYQALAAGTEGLIRQSDRPPVATTIAVLDPVSCRVISVAELGPEAHVFVDVDTAGQIVTDPDDPADFGTWPDIGARLPDAGRCAAADPNPRSTPAATPAIHDGVRIEPGAIDCVARSGPAFDTRIESVLGAVAGCVARSDARPPTSPGGAGVILANPDGDPHRLAVSWTATGCTDGATVSLTPTLAGYTVNVISISAACPAATPRTFGVEIDAVDAVNASDATATIDRVEEP